MGKAIADWFFRMCLYLVFAGLTMFITYSGFIVPDDRSASTKYACIVLVIVCAALGRKHNEP